MTTDPAFYATPGSVERIYDNVQATMAGVTYPAIQMELWNTIEEFCYRSTFFRVNIPFIMGPNVRTIDFNPQSGSMVVAGILKQFGLVWFRVYPPSILVDNGPSVVNTRQGYVEAFLKPASFDNGLPEALFNQFFEVILNGVKGRLFGHPGKPYSSPQFAEYNMKRFRVGINLARGQAAQLNSGQQAWRYPYFAKGRYKN